MINQYFIPKCSCLLVKKSYCLHNLCLILFLKYQIKLFVVNKVGLCFDLSELPDITDSSLNFQENSIFTFASNRKILHSALTYFLTDVRKRKAFNTHALSRD